MREKTLVRAIACATFFAVFILFSSCSHSGRSPSKPSSGAPLSAALAQIKALEAPPGTDLTVFESLKAEFESKLIEIWGAAGRIPAKAPEGDAGLVTDLSYDEESGMLSWSYANLGDYDLSGAVGAADVTPIAIYYLAYTDDGIGDDARESWIDGDGSGQVGIKDITVIALNYLSEVAEYAILTSASADGEYTEIGRAAYPENPSFPVTFDVPLPPGALEYVAVRPVDSGGLFGERSNYVQRKMNKKPSAAIAPSVTIGDAPLYVDFDASDSSDPDGEIVLYEWDYDGDGYYDEDTGNTPYASFEYAEPGDYFARVRVTDDGGLTDLAAVAITVTEYVNVPPVADLQSSVESGRAPLYVEFNASGSTDPDGEIVLYEWDFDGDGTYDEDSGQYPYAEYTYTEEGFYIAAVRVTDDGGLTDVAILTVNAFGNQPPVADFTWFEVNPWYTLDFDASASYDLDGDIVLYEWDFTDDGVYDYGDAAPFASYFYERPGTYTCRLRVTDNEDATDEIAHEITVIEDTVNWEVVKPAGEGAYGHASIALRGPVELGRPVISFYDANEMRIGYVESSALYGRFWHPHYIVENVEASSTSVFFNDGIPGVAFRSETDDELRYKQALNPEGTSWGTTVTLDGTGGAGGAISYAEVQGMPALVYYKESDGSLNFIRLQNYEGDDWSAPLSIADDVFPTASFAVVNGFPAVAFVSELENNLMFQRATAADGSTWALPEIVVAGDVEEFCSLAVLETAPPVPAIAYTTSSNNALMFIGGSDEAGSSWEQPVFIHGPYPDLAWPDVPVSLAVIAGVPCVSFSGTKTTISEFHITYKYSYDPEGAEWSSAFDIVPATMSIAREIQMINSAGRPGIVFTDYFSPGLQYAFSPPNF